MFNAKWGIACGGAAFLLALIISLLLGHTNFLVALARAGGFGALFFGLGAGIWALINIFIPELLNAQSEDPNDVFSKKATGARVNITLDDTADASQAALPDPAVEAPDLDEVGNFKDLVSRSVNRKRDIDQNSATGYTEKEEKKEEFAPVFGSAVDTSLGSTSLDTSLDASLDTSDGVKIDGLGDFSMDFGAFVPEGGQGGDSDLFMDPFSLSSGAEEAPPPPQRSASSNNTAQLQGDFDPREIAAGIRTVLEKDKKG